MAPARRGLRHGFERIFVEVTARLFDIGFLLSQIRALLFSLKLPRGNRTFAFREGIAACHGLAEKIRLLGCEYPLLDS